MSSEVIDISDDSETTDSDEPLRKRVRLEEMAHLEDPTTEVPPSTSSLILEAQHGEVSGAGSSSVLPTQSETAMEVGQPGSSDAMPELSSGPSDNDEAHTLEGQRNAPPAVVISPAPAHEEYFTDPMDPNEIPSDLEYSPPPPIRRLPALPPFQDIGGGTLSRLANRFLPVIPTQQMEDAQIYEGQLEVASASDINENPIEDADSTSGAESGIMTGVTGEALGTTLGVSDPDQHFADSERMESEKEEINSDQARSSLIPSIGPTSSHSQATGNNKKWTCYECHTKIPPHFRYCSRCFKIRRSWLPSRPRSRRLKNRKKAEVIRRSSNSTNVSGAPVLRDPIQRGVGTTQGPQSSSNPPTTIIPRSGLILFGPIPCSSTGSILPTAPPINLNEAFLVDDENPALNRLNPRTPPGNVTLLELFSPPQSQVWNPEGPTEVGSSIVPILSQTASQSSSSSSQPQTSTSSQSSSSGSLPKTTKASGSPAEKTICKICYVRPMDAAFVHNKVAHQYCCFTCADKVLKRDGKCPICRGRIHRVVKLIIV